MRFIMGAVSFLLCLMVFSFIIKEKINAKKKINDLSFTEGKGVFLKDGMPFQIISGSVHYFRVIPERWKMVLLNCKIAGLNTVETYVPWGLHFPDNSSEAHFEGMLDLDLFLQTAKDVELNVLLRIGPYSDAELDYGGLPDWLLTENVSVRTSDPLYMKYVEEFLAYLQKIVDKHLYINNGSIIMIQVENEYGSFGCETEYLMKLEMLFRKFFPNTLLYTTDGCSEKMITCGNGNKNTTLMPTVDFGPGSDPGGFGQGCFNLIEKYRPNTPKICSEFYTGWFSAWGGPHTTTEITYITNYLKNMLKVGYSVNMYVFMGGTNYDFEAGVLGSNKIITSYDYDGPLDQSGNPTHKFFAIQKILNPESSILSQQVPYNFSVKSYGDFPFSEQFSLNSILYLITVPPLLGPSSMPTLEYIKKYRGFTLFNALLPNISKPMELTIDAPNDELIVIWNTSVIGSQRRDQKLNLTLNSSFSYTQVDILHQIYGHNAQTRRNDYKRIENVKLDGKLFGNWGIRRLDINRISKITESKLKSAPAETHINMTTVVYVPFNIVSESTSDTYLELGPCVNSGYVILNKFNLGYYSFLGPQFSLYVPNTVLQNGKNHLFIFEFNQLNPTIPFKNCSISFKDKMHWR